MQKKKKKLTKKEEFIKSGARCIYILLLLFFCIEKFQTHVVQAFAFEGRYYIKGRKQTTYFQANHFRPLSRLFRSRFSAAAAADVPLAIDRSIRSANVYAIKRSDA
jgi:hypothetical protein